MNAFSSDDFARRLIAEALFYDAEYAVLGTLSLVDLESQREMVLASYSPDDDVFVVEDATIWEDYESGQEDDIGYALAVDSTIAGSFASAEEAAVMILQKAREASLVPSITMLFEEDLETP